MPSSPISPCPSCPPHAAGGHGCAVYSSSVTDAEWAILEPLLPAPGSTAGRGGRPEKHCPPCDRGRHLGHRARWYRGAATAGGVRASRDGVRGLRPLGPQRGWWQRILDALRDRLRVRAGRDRCPRRSSTRRRYPPPTPCPDPAAAGWRQENERRQAAHRGGCERPAARRRRHRCLDPGPRRRTPTPGRTARQVLHHRAGLGRRRLPRKVAHLGERRSHPYYADYQTHPRCHWFPRPAPHLGGREKFRVDQQAPPLRARLRNQTRPPRSHGPPRHDHDHDQATRPNLTVFKHPLEEASTIRGEAHSTCCCRIASRAERASLAQRKCKPSGIVSTRWRFTDGDSRYWR